MGNLSKVSWGLAILTAVLLVNKSCKTTTAYQKEQISAVNNAELSTYIPEVDFPTNLPSKPIDRRTPKHIGLDSEVEKEIERLKKLGYFPKGLFTNEFKRYFDPRAGTAGNRRFFYESDKAKIDVRINDGINDDVSLGYYSLKDFGPQIDTTKYPLTDISEIQRHPAFSNVLFAANSCFKEFGEGKFKNPVLHRLEFLNNTDGSGTFSFEIAPELNPDVDESNIMNYNNLLIRQSFVLGNNGELYSTRLSFPNPHVWKEAESIKAEKIGERKKMIYKEVQNPKIGIRRYNDEVKR